MSKRRTRVLKTIKEMKAMQRVELVELRAKHKRQLEYIRRMNKELKK